MADTEIIELPNLINKLEDIVATEDLLLDEKSRVFYSQDVFEKVDPVLAVVRPRTTDQVSRVVKACTAMGAAVIPRGGGMSYTSGYIPVEQDSVMLDMSAMNAIVEINTEDMFVTAESGVTWKQLSEALEDTGLRTPFWGTLSGIHATVGGGASQNGAFWGSGRYGAIVDSIVGLELVLADGTVLNTGAGAQVNSQPHFRHFGPDLTGLFCGDTGAFGFKTKVTLKLIPAREERRYISFEFEEYETLLAAMSAIARSQRTMECFAFDPFLQSQRMKRESIAKDLKQLKGVMKSSGSLMGALKDGAKVALAGRGFLKGVKYSAHCSLEEHTAGAAEASLDVVRELGIKHGGKEIENSLPKINRANPFMPVNSMIGPEGERWAPIHALVSHSKCKQVYADIQALFERHEEAMQKHTMNHGALIATVDTNMVIIEPVLYWEDAITEIHEHYVEDSVIKNIKGFDENLEAREFASQLKEELSILFKEAGTVHFQIGKAYPYMEGIAPANREIISAIKDVLDPQRRVNPGSLGL